MTITRIDAEARWSDVVIHNQTLYYTGVPANLDADAVIALRGRIAYLKSLGKTVVLSEHRLYYLHGIADRYVYL